MRWSMAEHELWRAGTEELLNGRGSRDLPCPTFTEGGIQ